MSCATTRITVTPILCSASATARHTSRIFFLNYDETRSNDFVLEGGDRQVKLFRTDISDWRITFVDTGLNSAIGERLRRVRRFVEDEPMFLANYADVFTDAPLPGTWSSDSRRAARWPACSRCRRSPHTMW